MANIESINVPNYGNNPIKDANAEQTSNKVAAISSSSTDTQYPTAKCVYDAIQGKQNASDNSLQTANKTVVGAINELKNNKMSLKPLATDGHFASFDENGDIEDSGKSASDFSKVSVSNTGTATDVVQYITVDGVEKKLATGGSGGTTDFDQLTNRPSYGGTAMNHNTNIPEVKTATWDGKYSKPVSGIPKTDLASGVQASLDKADTALQEHQSLSAYRTSAAQDVIDNGKVDKTAYPLSVVNGKLCITYTTN